MSTLAFTDDMARLQRALAQCHEMVIRRSAVLEALQLRNGERVLEVGCGGGFYAYEAAQCVGPTGRVCAIDISPDQVTAARARCAEFGWVECQSADTAAPPYGDAEFDAVFGVQVLEYVANLDGALQALHRVLRPGGRLVILATNWSALVWHSDQPERMQRVLAAFAAHALYPDLPALLAARLRRVGLQPLRQTPVPVLNMSYHANSFSYWLARMIRAFVVGRQGVTEVEAGAWLNEFEELERKGEYFFTSTPIITEAIKVSEKSKALSPLG
jgi:ubiquinone/menaquinone biosynthesis C-methylase UbiE